MCTMRMSSAAATATMALLVAAVILPAAHGCIFEFSGRRQLLQATEYNHAYAGLDWPKNFEMCAGRKQSPVQLPAGATSGLPLGVKSWFSYSPSSNKSIEVVNNGHTVQVNMPANFESDVMIPIIGNTQNASHLSVLDGPSPGMLTASYVKASPAQLHFHTRSEHLVGGVSYPLEMHIVHFISPDDLPYCQRFVPLGLAGCPLVLGVMLKETADPSNSNPALEAIWKAMPLNKGESNTMSEPLRINALLPNNKAYYTYEGSLTTPPCLEGLLWHVMKEPIYVTEAQMMKFREAMAETSCPSSSGAAGRRLMQGSIQPFDLPKADASGCRKLANGVNFREIQPLNGRVVKQA